MDRRDFLKQSSVVVAGGLLGTGVLSTSACTQNEFALSNDAGVKCLLQKSEQGWTLGTISFNGKPLEAPSGKGILQLRNTENGTVLQLPAKEMKRLDAGTVELSGKTEVAGVPFSFRVKVSLDKDAPVICLTPSWKVEQDLDNWEVGLAYHETFTRDWRVQSYPFAGFSEKADINPMRYCGIPGALVYTPGLSTVVLFAIDSRTDYLNPTTWTGKTRFIFENGKTAPTFYACGGKITAGTDYELPLQLFLDDSGQFVSCIPNIMKNWMRVNEYKVDTSLQVRTPQEAFDLSVAGRKAMPIYSAGKGYEHHAGTPFIYVGNNPYIAYYEYLTYCLNNDKLWRDRAFEQIDFLLKGQLPSGCFHTSYNIKDRGDRPEQKTGQFCSWDWGHNGLKIDINVWAARYILQTWQKVKEKEGIDKKEWYAAAMKSLDWAMKQQNEDGGFPQCVDILDDGKEGQKSLSVVSGRTMDALPVIAKITGNDLYLKKAEEAEKFMREKVENRFWYTGMHPDLPPEDFEQDSLYAVVEYWLDKYERTKDAEALKRAIANAYLALIYWCPKQLSWCKHPTQCAHSEQQHYNQYSVYCYGNRKIQCLDKLYKATQDPLFEQLRDRVMQNIFFVQVADGPYKGGIRDAIADPWLERKSDFDFTTHKTPYTSELVADIMIQLIEMGLVK